MVQDLAVTAQNKKILADKLFQVFRCWFHPLLDLGGRPFRPHWADAPPQRLGWSPCSETAN